MAESKSAADLKRGCGRGARRLSCCGCDTIKRRFDGQTDRLNDKDNKRALGHSVFQKINNKFGIRVGNISNR